MQSTQIDVKEYSYFAGNQWRKAADNQVFEVHEPYSGKLFARVAAASRVDARATVDAAAKAFPAWADSTPDERARLFLKASEIVRRRRTEIAEILARETGSTISFSTFQMDLVAATLQQVAGWVYLPKGEVLETNQFNTHSIGVRRPLGVCASFTPWNGANILSWRAVISPVAAGNTVVVKPSEFAPVSAGVMLAEVAEEAGFPAGVINVVTHAPGAAAAIADEFFDRPEVRVINLIGGVKTARMLAERAGRDLRAGRRGRSGGHARRGDYRRQSHAVRPHVFDSGREYLQGIRDGAESPRRHREREFTNRQRRDSRADGRRSRQRLGPHWTSQPG